MFYDYHFYLRSCHYSSSFFNNTSTTEIYPLSLHDALPISDRSPVPPATPSRSRAPARDSRAGFCRWRSVRDRKSTRLNSSHLGSSYAVFCLKKKKTLPSIHLSSNITVCIGTVRHTRRCANG